MIPIDTSELLTIVVMISVECIGVLEWRKKFDTEKTKMPKKQRNALRALLILILCSFMNSPYVNPTLIIIFNFIALGLSITQLAYQVITDGIPKIVSSVLDQVANFKLKVNASTTTCTSSEDQSQDQVQK